MQSKISIKIDITEFQAQLLKTVKAAKKFQRQVKKLEKAKITVS